MRVTVISLVVLAALGTGLALTIVGCGDAAAGKTVIPFEQLPAPLLKVAQDKLPDVTFNEVWRKKNGVYEIRGKNKRGKVREVEVNEKGEVVDVE
ncbi:MAG: hypothetical protein U0746_10565 [Gemmataceae bacterium]